MDDIVCDVKLSKIEERLRTINNLHPSLSFTFELEIDKKLPFLDMLLHNDNGNLSSSWYRKPTDTGLTLNFHALAPMKYKRSVVTSFVHRIFRSCSSWNNFHEGLNEAREILENNQYPPSFTEHIIKNTLYKLLDEEVDDEESEDSVLDNSLDQNAYLVNVPNKDKFKMFLTYRGKPTEQLAKSFRKLNVPCRIIMTLKKTRNVMPSLKTLIPRMLQSNVVYQIQCPGCTSSYVGQTVRHLQQRFREHVGNKGGPVRTHFELCNIIANDKAIKILGRAKTLPKLLTLEALFIKEQKPVLNTKDEWRSRVLTLMF